MILGANLNDFAFFCSHPVDRMIAVIREVPDVALDTIISGRFASGYIDFFWPNGYSKTLNYALV